MLNKSNREAPWLLYILGTGRSGTTILEVLLSANDNICSVGELTHIFQDGFTANRTCACGKSFHHCQLWGRVEHQLSFTPCQIRKNRKLLREIDWHKGFLKLIFNSISKKKLSHYETVNKVIYESCRKISGKRLVIDSSKYAARALMLNRIYGPFVKVICLTRSPEGILNSFQKTDVEQRSKTPLGACLYYIYVLLCCRIFIVLSKGQVLSITYEELTAFPISTINKIELFTGISFSETKERLKAKEAFVPGHIITGNRLRKNKTIVFKENQNTRKDAINHQCLILTLMRAFKKILGF
jgi:hypothetical protein